MLRMMSMFATLILVGGALAVSPQPNPPGLPPMKISPKVDKVSAGPQPEPPRLRSADRQAKTTDQKKSTALPATTKKKR